MTTMRIVPGTKPTQDVFLRGTEDVGPLKPDQPKLFIGDFVRRDEKGYWRNVSFLDEATHAYVGGTTMLPREHW